MLLDLESTNRRQQGESELVLEPACRIIGVLDNAEAGLSESALNYIRAADIVIGGKKMLALMQTQFKNGCITHDLTGKLTEVPHWVRQAQDDGQSCVVLASGDPLCYGIGAFLQSRLCVEACEIIPNVSTIQLACARLGVAWQNLKICSVHKGDCGEWQAELGIQHGLYPVIHALQQHDRVALLTSPDNSPDRIARMLVAEGMQHEFSMAVVENLLNPNERIRAGFSIEEAAQLHFADPNVVMFWRNSKKTQGPLFGLSDESFKQRKPEKGLITKREIRAVSLSRMQLRSDSIVWDIGAGSGSVGLEAALLARDGYVYAMEKNQADYDIALENKKRLQVRNYSLSLDKAPSGLEQWPDPQAIFVGGSGGELAQLIELCFHRLQLDGVLVMNFVTLENLQIAMDTVKNLQAALNTASSIDLEWDLCQFQVARSKPILNMQRLAAENPVWIMTVQKCAAKSDNNGNDVSL